MLQINGIQQLGVGVENLKQAFSWYREHFGMDILVFDEMAVAQLMLHHTEGEPRERHAILALNMQGGGGFEVWQHTGKKPNHPLDELQLGDLGIAIGKIKTADIGAAFHRFKALGLNLLTEITQNPAGESHFYLKDIYKNIWEFVESKTVFTKTKAANGGVFGTVIGVTNMAESLVVYKDILGYDKLLFDESGQFSDFSGLSGGHEKFRRVLLGHSTERNGAFSPLFGPSEIELIQVLGREPQHIYQDRMWGDPGFIHLCFDINGMDQLRDLVKQKGFPFTVDSAKDMDTFDMGEAAGSFAYIKAPEGTLIEFVETHKVPLIKKLHWYINLRKRNTKPLPRWIIKLFSLKRVKS